jgi:hypothetical protein
MKSEPATATHQLLSVTVSEFTDHAHTEDSPHDRMTRRNSVVGRKGPGGGGVGGFLGKLNPRVYMHHPGPPYFLRSQAQLSSPITRGWLVG